MRRSACYQPYDRSSAIASARCGGYASADRAGYRCANRYHATNSIAEPAANILAHRASYLYTQTSHSNGNGHRYAGGYISH